MVELEVEQHEDVSQATTNLSSWQIVHGSIQHALSFESSQSHDDEDDEDQHSIHADLIPKSSSLVLRRPSSHSTPCEITIGFAQQHEIQQVYVRSTARVYEIYYATDDKRENEYLCTVRCGVATRNEEPLKVCHETPPSLSTSCNVDEGHFRTTESVNNTKEDGWVVLKTADAGDNSLLKENEGFTQQDSQDLFEATAEISDAEAVLSVTLRFLSIQSGDHIYIDEVYVFADPVVSGDTDASAKMPDNSSGNAMMSMLVPTLLQLSKSQMSQVPQCYDPAAGKPKQQTPLYNSPGAIISSNALDGAEITMLTQPSICVSKPEVHSQSLNPENISSTTTRESHMERSLDELVSRVTKVEHFCLRFEENLLKPISNMEARLVKIEGLLESFVKNSQFAGPACNKFSAPKYSDLESESNSICADGEESSLTTQVESIKQDVCPVEELWIPPSDVTSSAHAVQSSDIPSSTTVSQVLPGLVMTAPDFADVGDEEVDGSCEALEESPNSNDSVKKPLSIDDVLASALAGFLSSTSTETSKNTVNVHVVTSLHADEGNATTSMSCKDLALTAHESLASDENCKKAVETVDKHEHGVEDCDKKDVKSSVDDMPNLEKDEGESSDLIAEIASKEDDGDLNYTSTVVEGAAPSNSVAPLELRGGNIDSKENKPDALHNFLMLSTPATVDFEIPILDVKFLSQKHSSVNTPLETLLSDVAEHESEVVCIEDNNGRSCNEPTDLVVVENVESPSSEIDDNLSMLPICDSDYVCPNTEGQKQQDLQNCGNQDSCESLI